MRFLYLRDPLFLVALALFALTKLVLKPLTANGFVHGHLVDCLCIPIWVPVMLLAMRLVGARPAAAPPRAHEILIPLVLWSVAFEIVLPRTAAMRAIAIADHLDVLCYAAGALVAAMVWRWLYREGTSRSEARRSTADRVIRIRASATLTTARRTSPG